MRGHIAFLNRSEYELLDYSLGEDVISTILFRMDFLKW